MEREESRLLLPRRPHKRLALGEKVRRHRLIARRQEPQAEHNGKVERLHRVDQEKSYRTLSFSSLDDLREQDKRWNGKYNNLHKMILKLKSPNEFELESLRRIMDNTSEVRCPKLLKRFTSADN
jgi:predicted nuclease with TOPRIM domain